MDEAMCRAHQGINICCSYLKISHIWEEATLALAINFSFFNRLELGLHETIKVSFHLHQG